MPTAHRRRVLLALPLLSLLLGSCVAQSRYDEAMDQVQYYQRLYHDLKSFQGELEATNARLAGELEIYQSAGPIEAAMTEGIDQRMAELEAMASHLGQPGDVTVLTVEGGYGLRLSDAILFDSGKAELRPDGLEVLQRMAQEIATRPFERVWVRGHSDADPVRRPETLKRFPHGNLQLSAARAIEVAAALAKNGIDRSKLVVAGFGAAEPIADNRTPEGKQKNRRVDIFVLDEAEAQD